MDAVGSYSSGRAIARRGRVQTAVHLPYGTQRTTVVSALHDGSHCGRAGRGNESEDGGDQGGTGGTASYTGGRRFETSGKIGIPENLEVDLKLSDSS